ncbi:hypothetical protein [Nocardia sp. NPDC050406]|uniref:hypothetical protein n=1 Tax=Nocardia sp. NPDC050406 TaxID=3364318 RepID=UPI0037B3D19E
MSDIDALDRLLAGARRVRARRMRGDTEILLDERDPVAVSALREALRIADIPGYICRCLGDVALDFFDISDAPLTTVTLHHGISLRWNGWHVDAVLADGVRSLEWLAVRGVVEPLREFRASERRRLDADRAARRWVADMPPPLAEYTELFLGTSASGYELRAAQIEAARARLAMAYPDALERLTRLLTWYASGTGKETGHPLHEDIPRLLLDLEHRLDFARAVETADARAAAGALRYLVDWSTRGRVGRLLADLSPAARAKVLAAARDSDTRHWLAQRIDRL